MKKGFLVGLTCLTVLAFPVPAFAAGNVCPISGCAAGQCFTEGYCSEACFTDANGDGICDNHCYADADGNGICDYFTDANEDGICDHCHNHGRAVTTNYGRGYGCHGGGRHHRRHC